MSAGRPNWRIRLAWLAGLWLLGVGALGAVAALLRGLMRLAGYSL